MYRCTERGICESRNAKVCSNYSKTWLHGKWLNLLYRIEIVFLTSALYLQIKFKEFKIQNLVATVDLRFPIRLENLNQMHGQFSSYEPELFPGLIYRMVKPRVVLLIFVNGKIVFTGAKSKSEINESLENIYPILQSFRKNWTRILIVNVHRQQPNCVNCESNTIIFLSQNFTIHSSDRSNFRYGIFLPTPLHLALKFESYSFKKNTRKCASLIIWSTGFGICLDQRVCSPNKKSNQLFQMINLPHIL